MKNLFLFVAFLLMIVGGFNFLKYVGDVGVLSDYGKGYLLGSIILLLFGSVTSIFIIRAKLTAYKNSE